LVLPLDRAAHKFGGQEMSKTYKKLYLTKYALTGGIQIKDFRYVSGRYWQEDGGYGLYVEGRDVFENEDDAIADAEKRRAKKIASLEKQIAKIKRLKFEATP
jgi:hypothetical protein